MSGLYKLLDRDPCIDLKILVSGAHLSPAYGYTVADIKKDGLQILAEIETLMSADSLSSRLKTASNLLSGSIDFVRSYAPDLLIYAGDREDVLVGAMLGGFLGIPTVHFFGGDHAADGHIDNPIRHATSKLSSAHFVSIPEHRNRLLSLGESDNRIFVIGSVALDKFLSEPIIELADILEVMNAKKHAYQAPLALLIFHPISSEKNVAADYINNAVKSLINKGFHVCLGATNTDPGNFKLNKTLENISEKNEVTFYKNLSRNYFVNLFKNADLIVGNSSAGLLEAASIPIPAINIGERQRGRLSSSNVIFCDGDLDSIDNAVSLAVSEKFQILLKDIKNPYGDGKSTAIASQLLKTLDFTSLLKKSEDPLHASN